LIAQIRDRAQARGDEADWTRALVREAQLRTALHGYETAARRRAGSLASVDLTSAGPCETIPRPLVGWRRGGLPCAIAGQLVGPFY
jgi:hypothetical protein